MTKIGYDDASMVLLYLPNSPTNSNDTLIYPQNHAVLRSFLRRSLWSLASNGSNRTPGSHNGNCVSTVAVKYHPNFVYSLTCSRGSTRFPRLVRNTVIAAPTCQIKLIHSTACERISSQLHPHPLRNVRFPPSGSRLLYDVLAHTGGEGWKNTLSWTSCLSSSWLRHNPRA